MNQFRHLAPAVALAAILGASACGSSTDKGSSAEDKAAEAIRSKILDDTGIHPGLSFGGVVVAATDQASSYLSGKGVVAENVKVTGVKLSDGGKTADGDVSFDVQGQTVSCDGAAMATKEDGVWTLGLLTVTSCH
jgi:hypothetical protein